MNYFENLNDDKKIELLKQMVCIREAEKAIQKLNEKKALHGTNHLCIGQEASNVGLCAALDENDWLIATHRGHGFYLAKCGFNINAMMAEMFGLNSGMCRGLGGSMHFSDMDNRYVCGTGVVAGGVPIGVGMALNLKYMNKEGIAIASFGDGASNQGMALESLNLASFWEVPVLFYCENNMYAVSSPADKFIANTTIAKRAMGFGIESETVDGNDIEKVYNAVKKAKEYMKETLKPYFIEVLTYRMNGHSRSDKIVYRTKEDEAVWEERCPIVSYKEKLKSCGLISEEDYISIVENYSNLVSEAVEECMNNKEIIPYADALSYVYSDKEALYE